MQRQVIYCDKYIFKYTTESFPCKTIKDFVELQSAYTKTPLTNENLLSKAHECFMSFNNIATSDDIVLNDSTSAVNKGLSIKRGVIKDGDAYLYTVIAYCMSINYMGWYFMYKDHLYQINTSGVLSNTITNDIECGSNILVIDDNVLIYTCIGNILSIELNLDNGLHINDLLNNKSLDTFVVDPTLLSLEESCNLKKIDVSTSNNVNEYIIEFNKAVSNELITKKTKFDPHIKSYTGYLNDTEIGQFHVQFDPVFSLRGVGDYCNLLRNLVGFNVLFDKEIEEFHHGFGFGDFYSYPVVQAIYKVENKYKPIFDSLGSNGLVSLLLYEICGVKIPIPHLLSNSDDRFFCLSNNNIIEYNANEASSYIEKNLNTIIIKCYTGDIFQIGKVIDYDTEISIYNTVISYNVFMKYKFSGLMLFLEMIELSSEEREIRTEASKMINSMFKVYSANANRILHQIELHSSNREEYINNHLNTDEFASFFLENGYCRLSDFFVAYPVNKLVKYFILYASNLKGVWWFITHDKRILCLNTKNGSNDAILSTFSEIEASDEINLNLNHKVFVFDENGKAFVGMIEDNHRVKSSSTTTTPFDKRTLNLFPKPKKATATPSTTTTTSKKTKKPTTPSTTKKKEDETKKYTIKLVDRSESSILKLSFKHLKIEHCMQLDFKKSKFRLSAVGQVYNSGSVNKGTLAMVVYKAITNLPVNTREKITEIADDIRSKYDSSLTEGLLDYQVIDNAFELAIQDENTNPIKQFYSSLTSSVVRTLKTDTTTQAFIIVLSYLKGNFCIIRFSFLSGEPALFNSFYLEDISETDNQIIKKYSNYNAANFAILLKKNPEIKCIASIHKNNAFQVNFEELKQ